jgi:hypothetical protein
VPVRLLFLINVKLHAARRMTTLAKQARNELVETTAGNLIASPRMCLMLSFDVACEVGQMERRR